MNTLLITGTIKPLVQVKYCDPEVRCKEYMRNLTRYICDSDFDRIIFSENSGYPIDISDLYAMADARGKEFRMMDVSDNADTCTMSTGEARILQQTLEQSPDLCDEEFVWKVSGRVFIRNANKILEAAKNDKRNLFVYAPKYDSLQTWFCQIKVGDLKDYFLTEPAIAKMRSSCIEYVWMDLWKQNADIVSMGTFPTYPDVEGINSSGHPYTLPRHKLLIKNILLKLG